ncbi:hypothetical protein [Halalkalibacterium ligniniphilum]|uniref:hypothetical protein n=1 Tax=Halalkalibacterium ligniniphilum TaxID=1134413 RepID=UPI00034B730E|nr:hypothetical protein [Halalkalibacterium ligniniphilum]
MIRSVYYYAVMFITLVMMIGGGVATVMNVADVVSPKPYYMSFQEYQAPKYGADGEVEKQTKSVEELRAEYELVQLEYQEMERARAINSLFKSIAWIIIPLPFFVLARKKASQDEK